MSGIKDQENIDELRKRLYDRGWEESGMKRHELTKAAFDVARGWGDNTNKPKPEPISEFTQSLEVVSDIPAKNDFPIVDPAPLVIKPKGKSRSYRKIILLFSLGIFILSCLFSIFHLFFGGNQISASNIDISINAPFAVAGGDVVPIQVGITNQNSVPIESATLIVNYPTGTKSVEEGGRDLYEERLSLNDIEAGGVINLPIQVILFGEENEDKEIKATIEYRVSNSNGTFFKEAAPVTVKINSSPLVIRTESVDKISSGQDLEITLTLISNAQNPMRNVLVQANYPNSFSFISSDPQTSGGQNTWIFDEILPNKAYTIKLKGLVTGLTNETYEMQFKAGNPRADNQSEMGSTLTQTKINYIIERPFIDVVVGINGDRDGSAILNSGVEANVVVLVKNTLDEAVYDMRVELVPNGNLINDNRLSIKSGFYDSATKRINWEIAGMPSLQQVRPGESREFAFSISPDVGQSTGSFDVSAKVFARRVNEASASESLIGTAIAEAKYSSVINLSGEVGRDNSASGPIPPIAGQTTNYTIILVANAGVNDISGGVVTTSLPQHVNWLNMTNGDGVIEYNPVSKQIRWDVGSISARESKQIKMQVGLLPSVTHIGRTLVLLESQDFTATDRFTGVSLRAGNTRFDNKLSGELGFSEDNGIVRAE